MFGVATGGEKSWSDAQTETRSSQSLAHRKRLRKPKTFNAPLMSSGRRFSASRVSGTSAIIYTAWIAPSAAI